MRCGMTSRSWQPAMVLLRQIFDGSAILRNRIAGYEILIRVECPLVPGPVHQDAKGDWRWWAQSRSTLYVHSGIWQADEKPPGACIARASPVSRVATRSRYWRRRADLHGLQAEGSPSIENLGQPARRDEDPLDLRLCPPRPVPQTAAVLRLLLWHRTEARHAPIRARPYQTACTRCIRSAIQRVAYHRRRRRAAIRRRNAFRRMKPVASA